MIRFLLLIVITVALYFALGAFCALSFMAGIAFMGMSKH